MDTKRSGTFQLIAFDEGGVRSTQKASRLVCLTVISYSDAARALYIDLEGGQDAPPSFVGIRVTCDGHDTFEQVVFEPALKNALRLPNPKQHRWPAPYRRVEPLTTTDVKPSRRSDSLGGLVESLVARAESEDRRIISWSSHECTVVLELRELPELVKERFVARWHDAKLTAKQWKVQRHGAVRFARLPGRGRNRLNRFLDLIGYELPSYFGDRQAAQRIDFVRQQLLRSADPRSLTPTAKAKWTKVLDYNWHDCNGMREVTLRAIKELA